MVSSHASMGALGSLESPIAGKIVLVLYGYNGGEELFCFGLLKFGKRAPWKVDLGRL